MTVLNGQFLDWNGFEMHRNHFQTNIVRVGLLQTKRSARIGIENNVMNASESRRILESRDDPCTAARQILKGNHTKFEMVDFEWYN